MFTCEVDDAVKQLVSQNGGRQFSKECFQEHCRNVDIILFKFYVLSTIYFSLKFFDNFCIC